MDHGDRRPLSEGPKGKWSAGGCFLGEHRDCTVIFHRPRKTTGISRARLVGLSFVFLWFFVGGIAHFAATDLEMKIVPPYVPWPRSAVLASGVFELLGAVGLLFQRFRAAAGLGLCLLTVAVTPANVYMLQHPELFDVPYGLLVLRLPFQVALLGVIAWSSCTADLLRRG